MSLFKRKTEPISTNYVDIRNFMQIYFYIMIMCSYRIPKGGNSNLPPDSDFELETRSSTCTQCLAAAAEEHSEMTLDRTM